MAEDFVELGIEGIDKLVDKHFHKVPNRYVDPHTYHPRCRRRGRGGNRSEESEESGESDVEPEDAYGTRPEEPYQRDRRNKYADNGGYGYGYIPPSQQTRDQYGQDDWTRRRPERLVRRSSSHPTILRGDDRETGRARSRRRSLSDDKGQNDAKGGSRGGGGAIGKPASKTDAVSLTLLGLAAAGLAATSVMTMMKHRERTKEIEEIKRAGRRNGKGDRGENSNSGQRERSTGQRHDQPAEGRRTKGGGKGGGSGGRR